MGDSEQAAPDASATAELSGKAVKGMAAMGTRSVVIRVLGLLGNLAIAPLLGPSGFGVVAIGLIFVMVGRFIADGGLAAGFLSREQPPTPPELRAIAGFQLTMVGILSAITAAVVIPLYGENGVAIALMAASLVITVPRVPTSIVCERELRYGLIIRADIAEALVYNVLAIGLVVAGLGVLGVGIATALKAFVGTTIMLAGGPLGITWPSLHWRPLGNQMRFGAFFQLTWILTIIRDEGLSIAIGIIGGTAALGAWALARRLLLVLTTVFETAWRVTLPGLARLMEAGESTKRIMEQGLSLAALGTGIPVVGLISTTPALVPALFGDDWGATVDVIPWMAAGMMLAMPVGTVLVSLLWVQQQADRALYMGLPAVTLSLGLGIVLIGPYGAQGAAMGYAAGQALYFVTCFVMSRDLFTPRAVWGGLAPTIAAGVASLAGYEAAVHVSSNWVGIAAGLGAGLGVYGLAMVVLDLPALRSVGRLSKRMRAG